MADADRALHPSDSSSTIEFPAGRRRYERHYAESVTIDAGADDVFSFADDFSELSSHMNKSSTMMMGGRMQTSFDDGRGRTVGSHVRMSGRMVGLDLFLEEVVTERVPPRHKAWETVGSPKLLVIGNYRLGFDIAPSGNSSDLRVFIDYDLPSSPKLRWLGYLLGSIYAKWCVSQMVKSVRLRFVEQPSNR
jgi:Polyketide cyclase / dehydrase and lipid transport